MADVATLAVKPRRPVAIAVSLLAILLPLIWTAGALARIVVIGRSSRGRAITAQVLGPNSAARKILLVGCIHGNECAGIAILSALAARRVHVGVQLWLVREMNPDGTAADTRQNAHGVDLNRNFPFRWEPISESTYFAGPRPASEPETRAAMALIERIKPAVTIWYHQHEDLVDMSGGHRGVARRYAHIAGLRATCLPFLPGQPLPGPITPCRARARSWWSCPRAQSPRRRCIVTCMPWKESSAANARGPILHAGHSFWLV